MKGPWDAPGHAAQEDSAGAGFDFTLELYQSFVSPGSGQTCPMEPSCSAYSRQCFARRRALYGFILTADRLLRCGRDELDRAGRVMKNGRVLFHDPVSNNDLLKGAGAAPKAQLP